MGNFIIKCQLSSKTSQNTKPYSFEGQILVGKIIRVYDGDTCTAIVKINGIFQQIKIRCNGYDSPEMKPPKADKTRDIEIQKANRAKTALEEMVLDKIVTLHIHGFDKYGRFLATIYKSRFCSTVNVNEAMISGGYGVVYFGGTKGVSCV